MRRRLSALLALVLLTVPAILLPAETAYGSQLTFAQTTEEDEGIVGEEEEAENPGTGGGEGTEPETEAGADEGEVVESEEEGPIWTYQMSKIVIGLLVLMLLGIGGAYWNFVAKRQKQGV